MSSEPPSEPPSDFSAATADRRLVLVPLLVTVVAGLASIIVAAVVAGGHGASGAVVGLIVVVAFFGLGQVAVARTLRRAPAVALNVALMVYLLQVAILFVLLILLKRTTWFEPRAFAATIFVGVICWTVASVITLLKTKVLTIEPGGGPPGES